MYLRGKGLLSDHSAKDTGEQAVQKDNGCRSSIHVVGLAADNSLAIHLDVQLRTAAGKYGTSACAFRARQALMRS